jgi:hypothetical protein
MNALFGVLLIALLDVLVPVILGAWLIVANVRGHRSRGHEFSFWVLALLPLGFLAALVVQSIFGVFDYDGSGVVSASVFSFPGHLVPVIATVTISKAFFDDASWASTGYFAVMPTYLVGLVLWQLVVIAGIRRLIQLGRRRERQPARVGPHPANRAVANRAA